MSRFFMGIDIGTYESKGVLIDEHCAIVAAHAVKHELENPRPNHFEHDAEAVWWGDFCAISRALLEQSGIPAQQVACVGSSALGADCLPVDEHCRPLRKAILYGIDARAEQEMAELTDWYGPERCSACLAAPFAPRMWPQKFCGSSATNPRCTPAPTSSSRPPRI